MFTLFQGAFLNDTIMPKTFNYLTPSAPLFVNGRTDLTSQRFHVVKSSILCDSILIICKHRTRVNLVSLSLFQPPRLSTSGMKICTRYAVCLVEKFPSKVAIVSNGDCASTCAMFSTLMNERHNTKIAVFGGKPFEQMEFKGNTYL